jgi:hypothetical protein
MGKALISRRQFLRSSLIATALAAHGQLPLLAKERTTGSGIDVATGPYATKPIRDYLKRFSPTNEARPQRQNDALRYNIVHWGAVSRKTRALTNSVVGEVLVKRTVAGNQVTYEVRQRMRIGGTDNFIVAEIVCDPDRWNSLRRWNLRSYYTATGGQPEPLSVLSEEGWCKDGSIQVRGDNYRHSYGAHNPVLTQWTVPDFLSRCASSPLNVCFDLLQDLSLFKPRHSLVYDGSTPVRLAGGETVTLQTYAQTGQGILPIHYLLDSQGRVQLVTSSILSWTLSSVEKRS